jgi:AcrR family transcriptional regulator
MATAHAPRFPSPPLPDAIAGRLPLAQINAQRPSRKPATQLSRTQILDATLACLNASGYDGTTIRAIAKRLDCAVGSIYRYFKDKRELLDAVCQRRFEPVAQQLEAGASLEASAAAYARAAVDEPEMYQLMFWLGSVGRPDASRVLPDVVERIIDGWSKPLGGRREAERFWSQLHGGIMLGRHAQQQPADESTENETDEQAPDAAAPELVGVSADDSTKARRRSEPAEDLTLL